MGTAELNYYNVLGVSNTATTSDIKKRYRLLSKQYHPDTANGDEKKMAQINEAYAVLSDPVKRHSYEPPKPKTTTSPKAKANPAQPAYNTQYYSTPFKHTNATKNTSQQRNATQAHNAWSKFFSYGAATVFIIIVATYTVPAANRFLAQYQAKSANAASDTTATNTPTKPDQPSQNKNDKASQPTEQYPANNNSYTTPETDSVTDDAKTESAPATPTEDTTNSSNTTAVPINPENPNASTNQPTEPQKTNNKKPNQQYNRINN